MINVKGGTTNEGDCLRRTNGKGNNQLLVAFGPSSNLTAVLQDHIDDTEIVSRMTADMADRSQ